MTVLQHSAVVGLANRAIFKLRRAIETSATRAHVAAVAAGWQERPSAARRFDIGVTLLTAAGVHLALRVWQGPDPGWLWLILPFTAAVIGALHVAASRRPADSH